MKKSSSIFANSQAGFSAKFGEIDIADINLREDPFSDNPNELTLSFILRNRGPNQLYLLKEHLGLNLDSLQMTKSDLFGSRGDKREKLEFKTSGREADFWEKYPLETFEEIVAINSEDEGPSYECEIIGPFEMAEYKFTVKPELESLSEKLQDIEQKVNI